jgi:hypothetical protein
LRLSQLNEFLIDRWYLQVPSLLLLHFISFLPIFYSLVVPTRSNCLRSVGIVISTVDHRRILPARLPATHILASPPHKLSVARKQAW